MAFHVERDPPLPAVRLAQVVEIMARARALLAEPDDDDVTDAEYSETEK